MIQYTYDHELITMTNMFLNSMSTIIVKRFNVHKQSRDQIKTRVLYAPKQRVLLDLLNKDQNLRLPVVAVTIGGISRDANRVFNKILGTYHLLPDKDKTSHEGSPLPIDITFNVSIMTRYQQDMDQIISHIIPYINPYFTVSWRTPMRPDFEIRSNVFWDGNVSLEYPVEITATQVARVIANLSFVFKGWMFQAPKEPVSTLQSFDANFNNIGTAILDEYLLDKQEYLERDVVSYNAVPPKIEVVEPYFTRKFKTEKFDVWGKGFNIIKNVYLSSSSIVGMSAYNPFASVSSLSASCPPFLGIKLDSTQWSYNRENFMTFTSISALSAGTMDIIIEGPFGYGKLTNTLSAIKIN